MNVSNLRMAFAALLAVATASPALADGEAAPATDPAAQSVPPPPPGEVAAPAPRPLPPIVDRDAVRPRFQRNERAEAERAAENAKRAELIALQKAAAERRSAICAENEEAGKLAEEIASLREQLKARREALDAIYQADETLQDLLKKSELAEAAAEEHHRGIQREIRRAMRERLQNAPARPPRRPPTVAPAPAPADAPAAPETEPAEAPAAAAPQPAAE